MTNIHIPPEAVEAATLALAEADDGIVDYRALATAAIRAALAAWPGAHVLQYSHIGDADVLRLPLTENPDADA